MFSIAVPGSSIPGPSVPDVVVASSELELVDSLIEAGFVNVVLACTAEALRHTMLGVGRRTTVLVVDARFRRLPTLFTREPELFAGSRLLIWGGAAEDGDSALGRTAMWCSGSLTASAVAGLAASHAPLPLARQGRVLMAS